MKTPKKVREIIEETIETMRKGREAKDQTGMPSENCSWLCSSRIKKSETERGRL